VLNQPPTEILSPRDAYRVARAAAPYSICAVAVPLRAFEQGTVLVVLNLWPELEDWTLRVTERVRAAIVAAAPTTHGVVVTTCSGRGLV
jgi:hypothetical protein